MFFPPSKAPAVRKPGQLYLDYYSVGFTLIEVMIAVAVSAIIFAAVSYGITTSYMLVRVSREQLRANQICLSRLEGIRLCRWDTQLFNTNIVPLSFTDYFYPVGLPGQTNSIVTYQGWVTLNTNVVLSPQPSYAGKLCQVTVTVSWTNQCANATTLRSQSMTTLVSQTGVQNYVYSH